MFYCQGKNMYLQAARITIAFRNHLILKLTRNTSLTLQHHDSLKLSLQWWETKTSELFTS